MEDGFRKYSFWKTSWIVKMAYNAHSVIKLLRFGAVLAIGAWESLALGQSTNYCRVTSMGKHGIVVTTSTAVSDYVAGSRAQVHFTRYLPGSSVPHSPGIVLELGVGVRQTHPVIVHGSEFAVHHDFKWYGGKLADLLNGLPAIKSRVAFSVEMGDKLVLFDRNDAEAIVVDVPSRSAGSPIPFPKGPDRMWLRAVCPGWTTGTILAVDEAVGMPLVRIVELNLNDRKTTIVREIEFYSEASGIVRWPGSATVVSTMTTQTLFAVIPGPSVIRYNNFGKSDAFTASIARNFASVATTSSKDVFFVKSREISPFNENGALANEHTNQPTHKHNLIEGVGAGAMPDGRPIIAALTSDAVKWYAWNELETKIEDLGNEIRVTCSDCAPPECYPPGVR